MHEAMLGNTLADVSILRSCHQKNILLMTYNGSNFSTAGKGNARCSFEPINRENKVRSDSARTLTHIELHVFGFVIYI